MGRKSAAEIHPRASRRSPAFPERAEQPIRWALILAACAVIAWIRIVPLSLGGLNGQATRIEREEVEKRLARENPAATQADLDQRFDRLVEEHQADYLRDRGALAARLKDEFRFRGRDGRQHVFLGDLDSYHWLRMARNYLRTGTTCDAVVNGECRDTFTNAPVGRRNIYSRSLHIVAIVAIHRLMTFVHPGYPLSSSSFFVPVVIGVLGVLPAFAIGFRMAGLLGGLTAAIVIGSATTFLRRSIGSDDDVWNVVLPLCEVWAIIEALASPRFTRQIGYAVLAGIFVGLHAATWSGWVITYGIVLFGLLVGAGAETIRTAGSRSRWRSPALKRSATAAATFYVASGVFAKIAGIESYLIAPRRLLAPLASRLFPQHLAPAAAYWPNVFGTVAELNRPTATVIADRLGGPAIGFAAWVGLFLMVLPIARWRWWHFAMLAGGAICGILAMSSPSQILVTALALVLIAIAVVLALLDREGESPALTGALIIIPWFLGSFYLAGQGLREVILLAAPAGVTCAIAVGRLHFWLDAYVSGLNTDNPRVLRPVLFGVLAIALALPVQRGYDTSRAYLPMINNTWWKILEEVRRNSPPDAIVNAWWDYGYWIKYFAGRRVSADGGSLSTHIPYWMAVALLAPNERQTAGLLRMLNCGSDATPEPQGREGAYGKLLAAGIDSLAAHSMVLTLAQMGRDQARHYLGAQGLSGSAADSVLQSTHCDPPPSYLVLNGDLADRALWYLGAEDFRLTYLIERDRFLPERKAITDMTSHLGYSEGEARTLYERAVSLKSEGEIRKFVSPSAGYLRDHWHACGTESNGTIKCSIKFDIDGRMILDSVTYRANAPSMSRLSLESPGRAPFQGTPALILLAKAQGMEEISFADPTLPDLAVLIDVPLNRALAGPPSLLRSTYIDLMFLDGRYSRLFEKVDERTGYFNETVSVWKIHWPSNEGGARSVPGEKH